MRIFQRSRPDIALIASHILLLLLSLLIVFTFLPDHTGNKVIIFYLGILGIIVSLAMIPFLTYRLLRRTTHTPTT